jgi:hypothetical protein
MVPPYHVCEFALERLELLLALANYFEGVQDGVLGFWFLEVGDEALDVAALEGEVCLLGLQGGDEVGGSEFLRRFGEGFATAAACGAEDGGAEGGGALFGGAGAPVCERKLLLDYWWLGRGWLDL